MRPVPRRAFRFTGTARRALHRIMQSSILFLVDALERPGGTETHLHDLSRRIAAHGFHPIVCNLAGDERVLRQIAESGVETWPRVVRRLYAPSGRAEARRIVAAAAARSVMAVHTFHFKSDWMGVGVARALRCPLISSRRDLGINQTPLRRMVYRRINRAVDAFIAPSEAVKQAIVRREGIAPHRIRVIHNGLELARFAEPVDRFAARAWLGVPEDASLVGMVGNLRPVKGHPVLLRAFARLAPVFPKAHLVLIGEGPEEDRLKSLAGEMGVDARVTFAGSRADIPRALAAMDVFVLSSHSEGMSNAILEAMAAGLPVVATDVGGNAECVVHGQTGFIVPRADAAAMAECLDILLREPETAAAMGAAGRARVADLFDVDGMVRRTADLYRTLHGARGAEAAHAGA